MKNYVAGFILLCIGLLSSALAAQEKTYRLEKKNGVSYINNLRPLWEKNPEIKLESDGFLGDFESDDENYILYKPVDIDADSDGNLYVLEEGGKRIQKYDPDGKYILTIGREGQGPSEFMRPGEIDVAVNNTIYTVDFGNNRVDTFTSDGKYLRSIRFKRSYVDHIRTLSTGEMVMQNLETENIYRFRQEKGKEPWMSLIHVFDSKGKLVRRMGEALIYKPDKDWRTGLNRIFYTVDQNDNIYVASIWRNRLEKFRPDGTQIFRTNRPVDPENGIEELDIKADKMLVDIDVDNKGRIWLLSKKYRRKITKEEMEKLKKSQISTSDALLAKLYEDQDPNEYKTDEFIVYLYNENGVLLHVYQLDHLADGIRVIGDKIYIVDKLFTMRFFIYRINDTGH